MMWIIGTVVVSPRSRVALPNLLLTALCVYRRTMRAGRLLSSFPLSNKKAKAQQSEHSRSRTQQKSDAYEHDGFTTAGSINLPPGRGLVVLSGVVGVMAGRVR